MRVTRRYREPIAVAGDSSGRGPVTFRWRDRTYLVLAVLGYWREDGAFYAGGGIEIPQRDLWRVEATDGKNRGVYELVHEPGRWILHRVWD
jgi:hypothetical protein